MRFLGILLLFVLAFQLISRYLFPFLLKTFIKKAAKHQGSAHHSARPEGGVTVNYNPTDTNSTKFNPKTVEDVEYEEIKEK